MSAAASTTTTSAADAHAPPGKQGRGRRLTDRERMEIIELTRANPRIKHVALATRYGVNESTIRKWRRAANSARIESRYSAGVAQVRDLRQRAQVVRNAAFDAVVHEWVRAQCAARVELSPVAVRAKARELAAAYDDMRGFKASSGWYYRFCRRYGLPCLSDAGDDMQSSASSARMVRVVDTAPGSTEVEEESEEDEEEEDEASDVQDDGDAFEPTEEEEAAKDSESANNVVAQSAVAGKRKFGGMAVNDNDRMQQKAARNAPVRTLSVPSLPATPAPTQTLVFDSPATHASEAAVTTPAEAPGAAPALSTTPTPVQQAPVTPVTPTTPATPVAPATPVTPATPAIMSSTPPPLTSPLMSTRQEAISHFLRHHKSLMSLSCRLKFIKHLAHANEDAEMYAVMDDETRVEYIREFAEADRAERSGGGGGGGTGGNGSLAAQ